MYYEERLIDGVMCFRTDQKGKFEKYSVEELSHRYCDQVERLHSLSSWIGELLIKARSVGCCAEQKEKA